jgi:hypothetical protein
MLQARNTDLYPRYERSYAELLSLLASESMQKYDSLPPLPEDLQILQLLEPAFGRELYEDGDRKPSATSTPDRQAQPDFNPWISSSVEAASNPWANPGAFSNQNVASGCEDSSDDELYI